MPWRARGEGREKAESKRTGMRAAQGNCHCGIIIFPAADDHTERDRQNRRGLLE